MNGYFQVINEETGTSIMLYPATEGGEELDMAEVVDYLVFKEISYSLPILYSSAKKLESGPVKIKLNDDKKLPEQEMLKVKISDNAMRAYARFYAPSNDGQVMGKEEILNDLKHRGVVFGILHEVLDAFVNNRRYCEDIEIALGEDRKGGTDGKVEYMFNTDTRIRPTLREDGSVDFFHLNTINNCNAGDLLAKLTEPVPGEPGQNVRGEIIQAKESKRKRLYFGKNVKLSEDGTQLYAAVSGHIQMEGEHISVSDVLEVKNVDNSTGNIEYSGSVNISGNVCENFSVKSGGNVVVNGVVEGAEIVAGGDVVIARGMNGMGKGKIRADGNVIAKFFENAEVWAKGYVDSDSIMHSTVNAGDAIHVGGKRGSIAGGHVCAANGIEVKNLGSNMGTDTVAEVGVDPALKAEMMELQEQIQEGNKVMKQAFPILNSAEEKAKEGKGISEGQYETIKNLYALYKMTKKSMREASARLDYVLEKIEKSKSASVKVTGDVCAGTRIIIGDVSMVVKSDGGFCKFVRERGDVKMKTL